MATPLRSAGRPRVHCFQITRKRRPLDEGGKEGRKEERSGVWEEDEGPASLPPFPNYSRVSTLTHSLTHSTSMSIRASVTFVAFHVCLSVSRSVPIDALRETESLEVADGRGRLFRAASKREIAVEAKGVEGEGAPNGLRTRTVSRKQTRARRGKLSRYTCY